MQRLDLLSIFINPLESGKIPYFVTGSIASIFYGEPRLTHDVDIVVHLSEANINQIADLFPLEKFYCPPQEVIKIENKRNSHGHFNLIHHETGFKADIYPQSQDPLHKWAFEKKLRVNLGAVTLWLAPAEYVIIRKLEYFREGQSSKHLDDIKKMLAQVEKNLDRSFLEEQIKQRGLESFWQKI